MGKFYYETATNGYQEKQITLKMGLGCRINLKLYEKLNLGINYQHTKNQVDQTIPTLRKGGGRRGRGSIETRIVKHMQIITINGKT